MTGKVVFRCRSLANRFTAAVFCVFLLTLPARFAAAQNAVDRKPTPQQTNGRILSLVSSCTSAPIPF